MKKNQVVVITGASAGLGRAIAHEFAKKGACLGLIARNQSRLESAKKEVENLGGKAFIFPMDVADADQMNAAAKAIENQFGPIDIWINNAMVSVFSPVKEMTPEEFRRVTEVTYLGYVWGTLAALKSMQERNSGTILQIGSALAYRAIPLQSAYCAAKHAVQGFTESLRSELIHDKSKIKISMIQLPALNTPHFRWAKSRLTHKPRPVAPVYEPSLIAKSIVWAASHYRREWYIGHMTAIAILGDKIASSWGDRYLAKHYADQEYDGLDDPHKPNNLFESVPGNDTTTGDFGEESKQKSLFIWLNRNKNWAFFIIIIILIISIII